ncbi:MAG TPA: T3SS effector HopA1 family protein [Burkholderiaceae bacterium]
MMDGIVLLSCARSRIGDSLKSADDTAPRDFRGCLDHMGNAENAQPWGISGVRRNTLSELLCADIHALLRQNASVRDGVGDNAPEPYGNFTAHLSAANSGTGTWENGWHIVASDIKKNQIAVKKSGVVFWVETHEVKCCGRMDSTMSCSVRTPKEVKNLDADYFIIFGNLSHVGGEDSTGDVVNFYWNLTAASAIDFVQLCTNVLNRERLHFKAKVLSDPRAFVHAEAGILSINRVDLQETLPIVFDMYRQLEGKIKPATPLFSKHLADGLGFAEEPTSNHRLGHARAKIIADAVNDCLRQGHGPKEEILQSVRQRFVNEGIDPMLPYALKKHVAEYEQLFASITKIYTQQEEELT